MKYKAFLNPDFKDTSFCYVCFPKLNKNAILYEVNMTGREIADKNYYLKRTGYFTYLINLTLSGEGVMEYKGKKYNLSPGDLLFIDCKDEHIFYPKSPNWEFLYIHVSGLGMQFLYDSFVNASGHVFKSYPRKKFVKNVNALHNLLKNCEMQKQENSFHLFINDEILCSEISGVVYAILMDLNKNVLSLKQDMPFVLSKALEYVKNNYNKPISLDDVAREACLSKFHFERIFKQYTGTTFYQYVKDLRFQNARWLLETTQKKLIDIAFEVGYSDIQALNKIFKKQLGVTPSEYRKTIYHY